MTFPVPGPSLGQPGLSSLAGFIQASPDPAHAVLQMEELLLQAGSRALDPQASWNIRQGGTFHVRLGNRALAAFRLPENKSASATLPFRIMAAHTDSPCLKLKTGAFTFQHGLLVTQTETYGSLIRASILDRPLRLSGEVGIRQAGGILRKTLDFALLAGSIPQLAIHLNREVNKGFEFNEHQHLRLVSSFDLPEEGLAKPWAWLCARELANQDESCRSLQEKDILLMDLHLGDAQPAFIQAGGMDLVNAPRLDNLAGCHGVLSAFLAARASADHCQLAFFFDHEEVGSRSTWGADSAQADRLLRRITGAFLEPGQDGEEQYQRGIAASWLMSVDAAQGWHPNFPDRFDPSSTPRLGSGPVLKTNSQQRYSHDLELAARVHLVAERAGISLQTYAVRADMPCGSTVGPMLASLGGIRTLDLGIPLLAMHSARELASLRDQSQLITVLSMLYQEE